MRWFPEVSPFARRVVMDWGPRQIRSIQQTMAFRGFSKSGIFAFKKQIKAHFLRLWVEVVGQGGRGLEKMVHCFSRFGPDHSTPRRRCSHGCAQGTICSPGALGPRHHPAHHRVAHIGTLIRWHSGLIKGIHELRSLGSRVVTKIRK